MRRVGKGRDWYDPKRFRSVPFGARRPVSFWWLAVGTVVLCLAVYGAVSLVALFAK